MLALVSRWQAAVKQALDRADAPVPATADGVITPEATELIRGRLEQIDPATMAALDGDYRRLFPGALHRMADHLRQSSLSC